MSVQKLTYANGRVRYRARVKWHGCEVATQIFGRRADALAWEADQLRQLRGAEWVDPRRGRIPLREVVPGWLDGRRALKRRTYETDRAAWHLYIEPRFGRRPINSITAAELTEWSALLLLDGLAPATARRALATFRSILQHAIADRRLTHNVAGAVPPPRGRPRREGQGLTEAQVDALTEACRGPYAEVVPVLAYSGLRWGELAGLRVGDLVAVPGRGLRVQRAVLGSRGGGELYVDTVKTGRARTVPLVPLLLPIVDRWADGRSAGEPLFPAPNGGYLREANWKRSVDWQGAKRRAGLPDIRIHDLRHTAASVWLTSGADAKVVQRVLGHATATMTLDLYGHLVDSSLWDAASRIGGKTGAKIVKSIGGEDG